MKTTLHHSLLSKRDPHKQLLIKTLNSSRSDYYKSVQALFVISNFSNLVHQSFYLIDGKFIAHMQFENNKFSV